MPDIWLLVFISRAWTLQSELDAKQTTTNGHLWFSNPVNACWTALYTEQQVLDMLSAAPHPPERAPLSHEAARKLVWSASTWSRSEGVSEDDVLEVIAAVERAQGIGATNAR